MNHVCNRCGCSNFHYNRSRMRMECDSCGAPLYDPQQDQQIMQFDRTYSQAMGHLAAGNWEQTISLLKPLMNQYPTEKKLYFAVLQAATQDFKDIDIKNTANRATASEAWDKLLRLNGVTNEMIRYSMQRYEKHRRELRSQRAKILAWIFVAALCSIIAGVCFRMEYYFIAVLCMGGLVCCLCNVFSLHPAMIIKQLKNTVPNYQYNPFI